MSKFYQPNIFENTFRYHSHLLVLLYAARRGTLERRFAQYWFNRITSVNRDWTKHRASRLSAVHLVLYSEDPVSVQGAWDRLRLIPGFLSVEEQNQCAIGYRSFLLQWYADRADQWHLEPSLVTDPFVSGENSNFCAALLFSGTTELMGDLQLPTNSR